LIELKIKTPR